MSAASERTAQDRWLGVEVRHLAALRAVASEGSFGAAALHLGYAQSAISQQVAALERHVGRRLFDRPGGSRPVTLTRAGELLLEHADSILSRLAAARVDLDSLDDEDVEKPLRIGASQAISGKLLPLILRNLGAVPGEVALDVRQSNDDRELLGLLEQGELDVAFAGLPIPEGALEAAELVEDPYVLLVHEEHPYVDLDRPVTLEEVSCVPLITIKGDPDEQRLTSLLAANGLESTVAHRVGDMVALQGYVEAELGSALVPRLSATTDGKPLVSLSVESRIPPRTLAIAWHRDRLRSCTAGLFVDLAVESASALEA